MPAILLFCAGFVFASCLNPLGFTPDLTVTLDGSVELIPGSSDQPDKPGDTSPTDDPDPHPDSDKGTVIFKNLTGGQKAMAAVFTIASQEFAIDTAIPLGSGQERSITLLPGTYDIVITFEGQGSPISGSKVLLAGRVEYVYFYVGKDGSYKGGINVDSSMVYGDIDLNFYQDNENAGENADGDDVARPEEGDVSRDNEPREKLPSAMRENYGIAIVHNLSKSMPLLKVAFDHYANNDETGGVFDTHWEMNPGPDRGNRKSIILHPGSWKVRAIWIDPDDPSCTGGVISAAIVKAGIGNYVNHLYFYKSTDGKYHLTSEADSTQWSPPFDGGDYLDNGGAGGADLSQEGQVTNENETINTGDSPWDSYRNNYGVVVVQNLSSRASIAKVTFTHNTNTGRKWEIPSIGIRNSRSIILEKGIWDVIIEYTWGVHSGSKTLNDLNVKPVGLTNMKNHVYFYYFDDGDNTWEIDHDYRAEGGTDAPPAYQNDGSGTSAGGAGEGEGDSPGSLTADNRNSLGLVVVKHLAKDADINDVRFKRNSPAKEFPASPMAVQRSNQRSILLGSGDWAYYLEYISDSQGAGRIPGSPNTNTATVVPGSIYTLYFYQDNTGGYSVTDNWPPLAPALPALTDGNVDPAGDNEGYLHIKNASSSTILTKLSYQYNGTGTEMNFPGNVQLVPGAETANDAILPVGTASIKFFNGIKQRWSGAVPVNIRARQVFTVTYTDGMDIADLPDGYGMVRVTNKSSEAVQSVIFYDTQMVEHPEVFTLPSGDTDSIRIPIGSYVAQFRMESFMAESIVTLDNGINRIVAITITDQDVTGKPNVDNPDVSQGGIRVHNAYPINAGSTAYLDMKIFKFYLYPETVPGSHTYSSTAACTFNGVSPYNPISRGQGENISTITPGYYRLKVVAGSYPWKSYSDGITTGSLTLNEALITYDCGEILIVKNQERQYYFNNYDNEKDTPNGYVTFDIVCSDDDNTYAIVHFEVAVRPNSSLTSTQIGNIYNNSWTGSSPADSVTQYSNWPGSWTGAAQGPYAPKDTLAFEWGGLLNSYTNQAGPFAVPPGIYWTRYNDNYTAGSAYGKNSSHWRLIDLRGYARQHVTCAADHTVGTNWAPVPQK
jgi:hypothetical protein